tara:strand:- start:20728 stop:21645 length:918 start_codon:yes stop_codon:yes gene_type:complete
MIKVSVIVPVYNVEAYLKECLDSLLNQDCDDYEVILINDGSTDSSLEIANEYKSIFKEKLIIISQDNSGLSSARNNGIENAKGEYIYFLDSDDYINNDMLSLCINCFELYNVDIVFFDGDSFVDGIERSELITSNYIRGVESGVYKNKELLSKFLSGHYIVQACCYMIRRSVYFLERFPVGILHEDNYYTTKILGRDDSKSYVLNSILYNRRYRENSIMTTRRNINNVNGYLLSGRLLYEEHVGNLLIKEYSYILYNRAVDIVIEEDVNISIQYKFFLFVDFIKKKVPFKLYIKMLFPKIIKLMR